MTSAPFIRVEFRADGVNTLRADLRDLQPGKIYILDTVHAAVSEARAAKGGALVGLINARHFHEEPIGETSRGLNFHPRESQMFMAAVKTDIEHVLVAAGDDLTFVCHGGADGASAWAKLVEVDAATAQKLNTERLARSRATPKGEPTFTATVDIDLKPKQKAGVSLVQVTDQGQIAGVLAFKNADGVTLDDAKLAPGKYKLTLTVEPTK